MDKTYIDRLLYEARMVAAYAVDTGQYPKNSRIFKEINAVARAQERNDDPAIEPLIVEMQKVCDEVGVTVEQVMRFDSPFGRMRRRAALATPYLVGLTTLVLTLYLAFQSSELHKADLALREYQDMTGEHLQEKLYLAWKMYQYDNVLNDTDPRRAQLDSYNKLVDDARRVYEKRVAVQELLREAKHTRYIPEVLEYHGPCLLQDVVRMVNDTAPTVPPSEGCPAPSSHVILNVSEFKPITCKAAGPRPNPNDRGAKADRKIDVDTYRHDFDCFLMSLQLQSAYDYPMDPLIYATRNKVNLLISWLLPGLYGLLGACVFLMRRMLHINEPGRNLARIRVVHVLSLVLRVALGGLAGIIIGWFWVPTSLTANSSAISVSSVPFGIAFLAGFSIDSMFALLEGLVKNFNHPKEGDAADAGSSSGGQSRRGRRAADEPPHAATPHGQRDAASPSPQPGSAAP